MDEQMQRVLVVENDPARISWFRRHVRRRALTVAPDYSSAVAALSKFKFDEVWLDFDLDGRRNGADVAHFMTTRLARPHRPGRVVVHSACPSGALAIEQTLRRVGFSVESKPFQTPGGAGGGSGRGRRATSAGSSARRFQKRRERAQVAWRNLACYQGYSERRGT